MPAAPRGDYADELRAKVWLAAATAPSLRVSFVQINGTKAAVRKIVDGDRKIFIDTLRYIEKFQADSKGLKVTLSQILENDGIINDKSILKKIENFSDADRELISEILVFLERFENSFTKFRRYISQYIEGGILADGLDVEKFLNDRKIQFYIDVMTKISLQFSIWNHQIMILKDYEFQETSKDILRGAESLQDFLNQLISDK